MGMSCRRLDSSKFNTELPKTVATRLVTIVCLNDMVALSFESIWPECNSVKFLFYNID
jgi:hypothetical protein